MKKEKIMYGDINEIFSRDYKAYITCKTTIKTDEGNFILLNESNGIIKNKDDKVAFDYIINTGSDDNSVLEVIIEKRTDGGDMRIAYETEENLLRIILFNSDNVLTTVLCPMRKICEVNDVDIYMECKFSFYTSGQVEVNAKIYNKI